MSSHSIGCLYEVFKIRYLLSLQFAFYQFLAHKKKRLSFYSLWLWDTAFADTWHVQHYFYFTVVSKKDYYIKCSWFIILCTHLNADSLECRQVTSDKCIPLSFFLEKSSGNISFFLTKECICWRWGWTIHEKFGPKTIFFGNFILIDYRDYFPLLVTRNWNHIVLQIYRLYPG